MWPDLQETVDLVTFTEETLSGKLYFCALRYFENFEQFAQNLLKVQTYSRH